MNIPRQWSFLVHSISNLTRFDQFKGLQRQGISFLYSSCWPHLRKYDKTSGLICWRQSVEQTHTWIFEETGRFSSHCPVRGRCAARRAANLNSHKVWSDLGMENLTGISCYSPLARPRIPAFHNFLSHDVVAVRLTMPWSLLGVRCYYSRVRG